MIPTIAAVATAPGEGGVGIIRITGPLCLELASPLARGLPSPPEPRRAHLVGLVCRAGLPLDRGLFLYFPAPASFTGEDVVELHAHGSPRLLQMLLREVLADGRARLAEPGEFTKRAWLNGKLDLAEAEAVASLVAAQSEAAVRAAAAQLHGALSSRLSELMEPLLALHADLEGVLNYPDEAEGADDALAQRLGQVATMLRALGQDARRGTLLRRGAKVSLYGPANAGKSTLFNRLVGEPRALVDEAPGTTRDALEARVELGLAQVQLFDTAGLSDAPGRLEAMGIERTLWALASSDLVVLLLPPGAKPSQVEAWRALAGGVEILEVLGKADERVFQAEALAVSGRTGFGVEALAVAIGERLWAGGRPGAAALVSAGQADALLRAEQALGRAEEAAGQCPLEVVAGELALAIDALGELTGVRASEAALDALFRRFCIGK